MDKGPILLMITFQRDDSQVLEKDISGLYKICLSQGSEIDNCKFSKVSALRKVRSKTYSQVLARRVNYFGSIELSLGGILRRLGHPRDSTLN